MKNAELWASYETYTKEVTANARRLGFAAVAICCQHQTALRPVTRNPERR